MKKLVVIIMLLAVVMGLMYVSYIAGYNDGIEVALQEETLSDKLSGIKDKILDMLPNNDDGMIDEFKDDLEGLFEKYEV